MKPIRLTGLALLLSISSFVAFSQTTTPALTAYYGVKDALVATDAANAKSGAAALLTALNGLETASLSATDKKALTTAKTSATGITKTSDVDTQRGQFETLSTAMIALVKATKPGKSYVQFCPMAADGKGAYWLSDKTEVRNPYYGDKMLKCGSVKEEI